MTPKTIDDILTELDQIILRARNERDRLGFFATLYRNVTIKVKEGIAAGVFEDGARMEKLDRRPHQKGAELAQQLSASAINQRAQRISCCFGRFFGARPSAQKAQTNSWKQKSNTPALSLKLSSTNSLAGERTFSRFSH